jgi:hypothetical protein
MNIKELTTKEVAQMLADVGNPIELWVRCFINTQWVKKIIDGINYSSSLPFREDISGWAYAGIEVESKMRLMTGFEMVKAVANGAVIKDDKDEDDYYNYYLFYWDIEKCLICYNIKEARTESEMIWQECVVPDEL